MAKFPPPEFHLGHDLSFVLHDLLTEHIVEGERAELLWFKVPLNRPEDAEAMKAREDKELWDWCEASSVQPTPSGNFAQLPKCGTRLSFELDNLQLF